jgi:hypothetical protein
MFNLEIDVSKRVNLNSYCIQFQLNKSELVYVIIRFMNLLSKEKNNKYDKTSNVSRGWNIF